MDFSDQFILKDFDTFLDFLNEKAPLELTNGQALLKGKYLIPLNNQMRSFQTRFVSEKNKADVFVLIQTFFFIAEKAEFVLRKVHPKTGNNELHINIERAKLYDALSENEKYFFLLDTFWSHIDWETAYDCRHLWRGTFYLAIANKKVGVKTRIIERHLKREGEIQADYNTFIAELLAAFGLFELEWDVNLSKRPDKYAFSYQTVAITAIGKEIIPCLFNDFGLALRSGNDVSIIDFFTDSPKSKKKSNEPQQEIENLSDVMKLSIKDWDIENKLLPIEVEKITGKFLLKVALDKKCYRIIELGGGHTFDDLHSAIQEAFDFDDDHLYAFFMDNKKWSNNQNTSYYSPHSDDGISADEVCIREARLTVGKQFVYLFDFGDCWTFQLTVEDIIPNEVEPSEARIIKSVGESPEQYEYEEEEEEE